jgi:GST-like protein
MIDLYYWPTPNGHKVAMFLEETAMPYRLVPVNIGAGEQFKPDFLAVSPNHRTPAIVDHQPLDGGPPISVFESGAILMYLADKSEQFLPADIRGRTQVMEWLFWQVAELETNRLYGVLDGRLATREFLAGAYSIADMAAYPWVVPHEAQGQHLSDFPHVKRWFETIKARPATIRAYELAPAFTNNETGS